MHRRYCQNQRLSQLSLKHTKCHSIKLGDAYRHLTSGPDAPDFTAQSAQGGNKLSHRIVRPG